MPNTYLPTNVVQSSQIPNDEIGWYSTPSTNIGFLAGSRWSTVRDLKHISNPATGDLRNKTWALTCTNFQMQSLPDTISGLQLNVSAQRNGRIVDEIIQLTYQGTAFGNNNFVYKTDNEGNLTILNDSVYGGPEDLWGFSLTPAILQDPSFGVILKFQSHPYYPHSSGMMLDSVSLTVY